MICNGLCPKKCYHEPGCLIGYLELSAKVMWWSTELDSNIPTIIKKLKEMAMNGER